MKDNFQISEGDPLEFTLANNSNNGDLPQAIRIKLISKDSLVNGSEIRIIGIVERDANDERSERNGRSNEQSETKQQTNGSDSPLISTNRQQEPGVIRYVYDGIESTIQYSSPNLSNTSALYCGDKVEFSMISGGKFASNISLIERNRIRGWIAILREGKGFLEQNNTTGNIEPIAFSTNTFTGDSTQIELGDEVEFSLRKISGRLIAENILKVSSTINNFYSVLPTVHRGRVVSPVRMISNDECEIFGRIQKVSDDGIPGECYTFSITGIKNKRVILLPNDAVTFSVAVGRDYSTRAVNIVLENETRKGKVDTVKGQFGFIDFACEENKKIFFHNSEIEAGFELRAGDEVEFYAQYNPKSGKPCASKLRRINNLQRPDRLITKLKSINFDENTRQKLVIVRQPRNADEKSKGFTSARIERLPGVLIKAQN
jgi:cold shock CspA family protein